MDRIRRTFLWHGVSTESKKMSLVNWSVVCSPKEYGGLGVMDLEAFNQALIVKWVWQWRRPDKALWKPPMKHSLMLQTLLPDAPIFTKEAKAFTQFCCFSFIYKPGNEKNTLLWHHNWGYGILRFQLQNLYSYAWDTNITLAEASRVNTTHKLFIHGLSDKAREELEILTQRLAQITLTQTREDEVEW